MTIAFFGHRSLPLALHDLSKDILQAILENVNDDEKTVFYCGAYGDFDAAAAHVCHAFCLSHPTCCTAYITPYMPTCHQQKIAHIKSQGLYDCIIYPPLEHIPPRLAIIKRNEWMIDAADLIIVYVEYTYGGAYQCLKYARKTGKRIINLAPKDCFA